MGPEEMVVLGRSHCHYHEWYHIPETGIVCHISHCWNLPENGMGNYFGQTFLQATGPAFELQILKSPTQAPRLGFVLGVSKTQGGPICAPHCYDIAAHFATSVAPMRDHVIQ